MKTIMNLVTEKINKAGALIVAAGMSSRMNDFKPLMKIGRYSMIENAVINYKNSGIDEIIIVTGFRENDIKEKLTVLPAGRKRRQAAALQRGFEHF